MTNARQKPYHYVTALSTVSGIVFKTQKYHMPRHWTTYVSVVVTIFDCRNSTCSSEYWRTCYWSCWAMKTIACVTPLPLHSAGILPFFGVDRWSGKPIIWLDQWSGKHRKPENVGELLKSHRNLLIHIENCIIWPSTWPGCCLANHCRHCMQHDIAVVLLFRTVKNGLIMQKKWTYIVLTTITWS